MRINIKWLQTGGVPLTNDVMDVVMEAIETFNVIGDLAGNLTILSGCTITGQNVSPGIVAINGDVLYFEGGNIYSTVYIHTDEIVKTFQDTTDKVLIEKKVVKFGNATTQYLWTDFFRLETLKTLSEKIALKANQSQVDDHEQRILLLEKKTAPIVNNGVVMIWARTEPIPPFWRECVKLRGRTPIGFDPNYAYNATIHAINYKLNEVGADIGELQHQLTVAELAKHRHYGKSMTYAESWRGNGFRPDDYNNDDGYTEYEGGDKPHNNVQPSQVVIYIEPNF